ncbi:MAG: tRNA-intron lyase [Candidatus Thorarchaeota archaeon]|nr:tRNA-intron lyase [Candidatus Thorarchaeota archaeon]
MNETSPIADARLVGDRGIVWNPDHGMKLYEEGYFGQPVGIRKPKSSVFDKPLELSLIECVYLTQQKRLNVRHHDGESILGVEDLLKLGSECFDEFKDRFIVYSQLRERGYIVRPGLKFGTDFAVYLHGPGKDHAPFLVHVIPQRKGVVPLDIVRAGRLATSVRKKFIIATVKENGEIAYYSFVWHRP